MSRSTRRHRLAFLANAPEGLHRERHPCSHLAVAIGVALSVTGSLRAQINQGQIDTFEDTTAMSWTIGRRFAGPTVQLGGPGGAGDHFLQLDVNQFGGPPRLIIFNQSAMGRQLQCAVANRI